MDNTINNMEYPNNWDIKYKKSSFVTIELKSLFHLKILICR